MTPPEAVNDGAHLHELLQQERAERQRVEAELCQARQELEQRVGELEQANHALKAEIAERQRTEEELEYRVAFEALIIYTTTTFINLNTEQIDEGITRALQAIGLFEQVDRSYVFLLVEHGTIISNTHEWCAEGITPQKPRLQAMPLDALPWFAARAVRGEVLHVPRVDDLPPEAAAERAELRIQGTRSMVAVPLVAHGETIGVLGFDAVREEKRWSDEGIALLKIVGQIFVNALQRKHTEQAFKTSEENMQSLLENATNFAVYRVAVTGTDPHQARCVLFSRSIQAIVGMDEPERFERWLEHIHPDDLPRLQEALRAAREGHPLDMVSRVYHPHKQTWVWIHTRATPTFDDQGQLTHFNGVIVDVTRQQEAAEALRESERQHALLLSNLPGMAYRCVNAPEWPLVFVSEGCYELTGYTPDEIMALDHSLVPPEVQPEVRQEVQRALDEHYSFQLSYRIVTASGQEKWILNRGRGVYTADGELVAIEGFANDITERVMMQHLLEQRVEERTNELATLYAETRRRADETHALLTIQQALTRHLNPDDVLHMIADVARNLTVASFSAVFLRGEDEGGIEYLYVSMVVGDHNTGLSVGHRVPLHRSATGLAITTRQPVRINDTEYDQRVNADAVQRARIRSLVAVPLVSGSAAIGAITVGHRQPHMFGDNDEQVLAMLAPGAVIALENARFYREEQQQRRELQALYRADAELYRHLNLDDVLQALVDVVVDILHADKSALLVCENQQLVVKAARGFQRETLQHMAFSREEELVQTLMCMGQPILIDDAARAPALVRRLVEMEHICSLMTVPIMLGDRFFGVFSVSYTTPRTFGPEDQRLVAALAQRTALAIENAQFHEQAQQAAALEERQHLARELHDAVTQTLFSASLIADVLPRLWERNPEQGRQRLQELRQLTRGALAEMRTLLLELRPSALQESSIDDLLRQLAEAMSGRAHMPVTLSVSGEESAIPADVKVVFYRIAQEALHNIAHHAAASQATLRLERGGGRVALHITDDGCGFDLACKKEGHLGLGIMHERASAVGATLHIASSVGEGTHVSVRWQEETS